MGQVFAEEITGLEFLKYHGEFSSSFPKTSDDRFLNQGDSPDFWVPMMFCTIPLFTWMVSVLPGPPAQRGARLFCLPSDMPLRRVPVLCRQLCKVF